MKRQYLGDSKDSFKWDYHDYLMSELKYPLLNVILMMTPDDSGSDGKSHPTLFPARNEIIEFCQNLQKYRDIEQIRTLPQNTGSSYIVRLHRDASHVTKNNRNETFSGIDSKQDQIVFLDPDNGLEPKRFFTEKHVRYSELTQILEQLTPESIITVFQHFRRISFTKDFARIQERIELGYATALYWHSLMFVAIAKSEKTIDRIVTANHKYAEINPVVAI